MKFEIWPFFIFALSRKKCPKSYILSVRGSTLSNNSENFDISRTRTGIGSRVWSGLSVLDGDWSLHHGSGQLPWSWQKKMYSLALFLPMTPFFKKKTAMSQRILIKGEITENEIYLSNTFCTILKRFRSKKFSKKKLLRHFSTYGTCFSKKDVSQRKLI